LEIVFSGKESTTSKPAASHQEPPENLAIAESRPQEKISLSLDKLVKISGDDLNLKFLFDHVRNYGIAAAVVAVGMGLLTEKIPYTSTWPMIDKPIAIMLMLVGLVLCVFNIMQNILIVAKIKPNSFSYYFYAMATFLLGSTLFGGTIMQIFHALR